MSSLDPLATAAPKLSNTRTVEFVGDAMLDAFRPLVGFEIKYEGPPDAFADPSASGPLKNSLMEVTRLLAERVHQLVVLESGIPRKPDPQAPATEPRLEVSLSGQTAPFTITRAAETKEVKSEIVKDIIHLEAPFTRTVHVDLASLGSHDVNSMKFEVNYNLNLTILDLKAALRSRLIREFHAGTRSRLELKGTHWIDLRDEKGSVLSNDYPVFSPQKKNTVHLRAAITQPNIQSQLLRKRRKYLSSTKTFVQQVKATRKTLGAAFVCVLTPDSVDSAIQEIKSTDRQVTVTKLKMRCPLYTSTDEVFRSLMVFTNQFMNFGADPFTQMKEWKNLRQKFRIVTTDYATDLNIGSLDEQMVSTVDEWINKASTRSTSSDIRLIEKAPLIRNIWVRCKQLNAAFELTENELKQLNLPVASPRYSGETASVRQQTIESKSPGMKTSRAKLKNLIRQRLATDYEIFPSDTKNNEGKSDVKAKVQQSDTQDDLPWMVLQDKFGNEFGEQEEISKFLPFAADHKQEKDWSKSLFVILATDSLINSGAVLFPPVYRLPPIENAGQRERQTRYMDLRLTCGALHHPGSHLLESYSGDKPPRCWWHDEDGCDSKALSKEFYLQCSYSNPFDITAKSSCDFVVCKLCYGHHECESARIMQGAPICMGDGKDGMVKLHGQPSQSRLVFRRVRPNEPCLREDEKCFREDCIRQGTKPAIMMYCRVCKHYFHHECINQVLAKHDHQYLLVRATIPNSIEPLFNSNQWKFVDFEENSLGKPRDPSEDISYTMKALKSFAWCQFCVASPESSKWSYEVEVCLKQTIPLPESEIGISQRVLQVGWSFVGKYSPELEGYGVGDDLQGNSVGFDPVAGVVWYKGTAYSPDGNPLWEPQKQPLPTGIAQWDPESLFDTSAQRFQRGFSYSKLVQTAQERFPRHCSAGQRFVQQGKQNSVRLLMKRTSDSFTFELRTDNQQPCIWRAPNNWQNLMIDRRKAGSVCPTVTALHGTKLKVCFNELACSPSGKESKANPSPKITLRSQRYLPLISENYTPVRLVPYEVKTPWWQLPDVKQCSVAEEFRKKLSKESPDYNQDFGVCFSGGGIRSTSFSSGVLCGIMSAINKHQTPQPHQELRLKPGMGSQEPPDYQGRFVPLRLPDCKLPRWNSAVSGGGYLAASYVHWSRNQPIDVPSPHPKELLRHIHPKLERLDAEGDSHIQYLEHWCLDFLLRLKCGLYPLFSTELINTLAISHIITLVKSNYFRTDVIEWLADELVLDLGDQNGESKGSAKGVVATNKELFISWDEFEERVCNLQLDEINKRQDLSPPAALEAMLHSPDLSTRPGDRFRKPETKMHSQDSSGQLPEDRSRYLLDWQKLYFKKMQKHAGYYVSWNRSCLTSIKDFIMMSYLIFNMLLVSNLLLLSLSMPALFLIDYFHGESLSAENPLTERASATLLFALLCVLARVLSLILMWLAEKILKRARTDVKLSIESQQRYATTIQHEGVSRRLAKLKYIPHLQLSRFTNPKWAIRFQVMADLCKSTETLFQIFLGMVLGCQVIQLLHASALHVQEPSTPLLTWIVYGVVPWVLLPLFALKLGHSLQFLAENEAGTWMCLGPGTVLMALTTGYVLLWRVDRDTESSPSHWFLECDDATYHNYLLLCMIVLIPYPILSYYKNTMFAEYARWRLERAFFHWNPKQTHGFWPTLLWYLKIAISLVPVVGLLVNPWQPRSTEHNDSLCDSERKNESPCDNVPIVEPVYLANVTVNNWREVEHGGNAEDIRFGFVTMQDHVPSHREMVLSSEGFWQRFSPNMTEPIEGVLTRIPRNQRLSEAMALSAAAGAIFNGDYSALFDRVAELQIVLGFSMGKWVALQPENDPTLTSKMLWSLIMFGWPLFYSWLFPDSEIFLTLICVYSIFWLAVIAVAPIVYHVSEAFPNLTSVPAVPLSWHFWQALAGLQVWTTGTVPSDLYLSDGGHTENLGILPLLHRRLRFIIAVNGGADPLHRDIRAAMDTARVKLGCSFKAVYADQLRRNQKPFSEEVNFPFVDLEQDLINFAKDERNRVMVIRVIYKYTEPEQRGDLIRGAVDQLTEQYNHIRHHLTGGYIYYIKPSAKPPPFAMCPATSCSYISVNSNEHAKHLMHCPFLQDTDQYARCPRNCVAAGSEGLEVFPDAKSYKDHVTECFRSDCIGHVDSHMYGHLLDEKLFGDSDIEPSTTNGCCCVNKQCRSCNSKCCYKDPILCGFNACCGKFPYHSTANQCFTPELFSAYHIQGKEAAREAFGCELLVPVFREDSYLASDMFDHHDAPPGQQPPAMNGRTGKAEKQMPKDGLLTPITPEQKGVIPPLALLFGSDEKHVPNEGLSSLKDTLSPRVYGTFPKDSVEQRPNAPAVPIPPTTLPVGPRTEGVVKDKLKTS